MSHEVSATAARALWTSARRELGREEGRGGCLKPHLLSGGSTGGTNDVRVAESSEGGPGGVYLLTALVQPRPPPQSVMQHCVTLPLLQEMERDLHLQRQRHTHWVSLGA